MFAQIADLRLRALMSLRIYVLASLCPVTICLHPYVGFGLNPRLWYVWIKLVCSPRLPTWAILEIFLALGSSPFSLAKPRLHANPGPGFRRYLCHIINPSFWKILMTSLRVILRFAPHQSKILAMLMYPVNVFFLNFNHIWLKKIHS